MNSVFSDVTTVAGEMLAGVLKAVSSRGSDTKKFHIVSFGVGAHIAAVAAKSMHPHVIGRITGNETCTMRLLCIQNFTIAESRFNCYSSGTDWPALRPARIH